MFPLPELPHNFHEGRIDALRIGPRRELTLTLTGYFPVLGSSQQSFRVETWQVRFGGIDNIGEVGAFCSPALVGRRIGRLHFAR